MEVLFERAHCVGPDGSALLFSLAFIAISSWLGRRTDTDLKYVLVNFFFPFVCCE